MSHNISDRTRRANIPAGCLDDLLDWRFLITCPRCREQRIITVTVMAAQAGRSEWIGQVVTRLRCSISGCGAQPSAVVINNRLHEVALKGPGAFS